MGTRAFGLEGLHPIRTGETSGWWGNYNRFDRDVFPKYVRQVSEFGRV